MNLEADDSYLAGRLIRWGSASERIRRPSPDILTYP